MCLKTWPNCHARFYSAGADAIVRLWSLDAGESSPGHWHVSGRVATALKGHSKGVYCLEYILAQHYVASAGFDHDVFVWNPLIEVRDDDA